MSDAGSIVWRLGLDSSDFHTTLLQAARGANEAHDAMGAAVNRNVNAHESLLNANHRVARQIQNFAQDLQAGSSGIQLFSQGLEGLERALNLPIGALAALGVGAVVLEGLHKGDEAVRKLSEDMQKLSEAANADPRFESLADLTSRLAELRKKADELAPSFSVLRAILSSGALGLFIDTNAEQSSRFAADKFSNWLAQSKTLSAIASKEQEGSDVIEAGQRFSPYQAERLKAGQKYDEEIGAAKGNSEAEEAASRRHDLVINEITKRENAAKDLIEYEKAILDIRKQGGEIEEKLGQAKIDYLEKAVSLATSEFEKSKAEYELEKAKQDLADKAASTATANAKAARNRVALSLADVASRPDQFSNDFSPQATYESQQARKAIQLKDQAADTVFHQGSQGFDKASGLLSEADKIVKSIDSLKESEIDKFKTGLSSALDASKRLENIETNTKGMYANR